MEVPIMDFGGGNTGQLDVPDSVFARQYNAALAHQVLTSVLANARCATRKQKTRGEVHHTTRKLFRQKGTGRARAGHSSTPIRRGGGRAFPASPNDNFHHKLTRKMYRLAMAVILSQLVREQRLWIVRSLSVETHKTQDLCKSLTKMNLSGKTLFVDTEFDSNFVLASRNLVNIKLSLFRHLLPTDIVRADVTIISEQALKTLTELWA